MKLFMWVFNMQRRTVWKCLVGHSQSRRVTSGQVFFYYLKCIIYNHRKYSHVFITIIILWCNKPLEFSMFKRKFFAMGISRYWSRFYGTFFFLYNTIKRFMTFLIGFLLAVDLSNDVLTQNDDELNKVTRWWWVALQFRNSPNISFRWLTTTNHPQSLETIQEAIGKVISTLQLY